METLWHSQVIEQKALHVLAEDHGFRFGDADPEGLTLSGICMQQIALAEKEPEDKSEMSGFKKKTAANLPISQPKTGQIVDGQTDRRESRLHRRTEKEW